MITTDISDIIKHRRSVFPAQYNDQPISKTLLQTILNNANWAPTHRLTEPWRFKVIQKEAKNRLGQFLADKYKAITPDQAFSEFKYNKIQKKCAQSDTILLICMQRDPKEQVPEWEEVASVAMAVQNMWLTCSTHGVGCYWSTPKMIEHMNEFVTLGAGETCLGLFYMGHYTPVGDQMTTKRHPIEEKVVWME